MDGSPSLRLASRVDAPPNMASATELIDTLLRAEGAEAAEDAGGALLAGLSGGDSEIRVRSCSPRRAISRYGGAATYGCRCRSAGWQIAQTK